MTEETKQLLIKRLQSFAWRLGAMLAVAMVAFIAQNLDLLHVNPELQILIGLILGEVTKWLNTRNS